MDFSLGASDKNRHLEVAVGARIRELRKRAGVTMAELAKSSTISTGTLSKIENGQISPSLATMQKLSEALCIPIASLFKKFDKRLEPFFVGNGGGSVVERRGSSKGYSYKLLGKSSGSNRIFFEPLLVTLTENSEPFPYFQHEGEEYIYLLQGEVTYRYGNQDFDLKPGDSLSYDSEILHGPLKLIKLPAVFLVMVASQVEN